MSEHESGEKAGVPLRSRALEILNLLPKGRLAMLQVSLAAGVVFILALTLFLSGRAAQLVLDRQSTLFPYPFTIQNLEHLAFFVALGELFLRWRTAQTELSQVDQGYLPEDEATVLQAADLGPLRRRTLGQFDGDNGFLPSLINLSILQYQASRSVDQTVSVLNSRLELISHRVNLRYQMIRYLVWFIPTIGFLGTVVGIGSTLGLVPKSGSPDLYELANNLAVAFNTTIVALAESAVLVFLLHVIEAQEERAVNQAGDYCLTNLINRLYSGAP